MAVIAERYGERRAIHARRLRLRAAVLQAGSLLGWRPCEVLEFTEALTSRSWRHCGCGEFEAALDEYLKLAAARLSKVERPNDGRGRT